MSCLYDWETLKMDRDYFQDALHTFNGANWYGWKTHDDDSNGYIDKIEPGDRAATDPAVWLAQTLLKSRGINKVEVVG